MRYSVHQDPVPGFELDGKPCRFYSDHYDYDNAPLVGLLQVEEGRNYLDTLSQPYPIPHAVIPGHPDVSFYDFTHWEVFDIPAKTMKPRTWSSFWNWWS